MKKLLATSIIATALATTAFADSQRRYAEVTKVQPRYSQIQHVQPIRECYTVEVPVYGNVGGGNGASGADVLGGMIIGALLGKGVTGKDNGAAAGAVLGGVIAADKKQSRQVISGYKVERQCFDTVQYRKERKFKNNLIHFEWNGVRGSAYTYNNYRVGQSIPVTVTIRAN